MENKKTSLLQEIGTYVSILAGLASILAAITSSIAASLGFGLNEKLLYSLLLCFLISFAYLSHQRQKAVQQIEEHGVVQRPQWFWRLVTNRLTHKPERLIKGIVMVVVPPNLRKEAETLKDIHNQNQQFNLLFHYLPLPKPGDLKIDENIAESKLDIKRRSPDILSSQLEDCAGIVLLDDCDWKTHKERYPKTWNAINDWSNKFTCRPVMSIRIQGEGTLKYSWCDLDEIINNNQELLSNLLAQATNRGKDWHSQVITQRKVFRLTGLAIAVALIISLIVNYSLGKRVQQIEAETPKLTRVMKTNSGEQWHLAEHLTFLRNSPESLPRGEALQKFLKGIASQLQGKIVESSGIPGNVDVILFALNKDARVADRFSIDEVVATREPPRDFDFSYQLEEDHSTSIVGCAIARRSFVYWVAFDESANATKDIAVWKLDGTKSGEFDANDKKWKVDGKTCELGLPPKQTNQSATQPDDPRVYLLCAPAGISDSSSMRPAGAICISSKVNLELHEDWARQLLLQYGNLLSFFNWEMAIPNNSRK